MSRMNALLRSWIATYKNEIILSFIWILAIIIINPIGEFPLNDDWAYSKNVYHLSQEGRLLLSDWPAMTLIAQVIWGAFVTWIFGFSFTVLRLSTLIVGLITAIFYYRILIYTLKNRTSSFAGTLLLMFTPLYFSSSYTFMTEVYFLFTLIMSLYYFFKYYDTEKTNFLLAGSFFVLICTLIRQPGVAIGIAFAVIYLTKKRFTIKHLVISVTPTISALTGLFLYSLWIKNTGRVTNISDFGILTKHISEAPFGYYLGRFGLVTMYFGLFSLPISIIVLPRILKKYNWYEYIVILLLAGMTFMSGFKTSFPAGNVFFNLGLGPKLLKDTYWKDNLDPLLSEQTMYFIKLISLLSAVIIVVWFSIETIKGIKKFFTTKNNATRLIRATAIIFFMIYFGFVLINPMFFDRYVLPCLPFLFLIILPIKPIFTRNNRVIFGILLSIYVIFSITATHDYLSWNKTRWQAIKYLTEEEKVERTKIDGGFEFNAWYQTAGWNPEIKDQKSWWCVASDDYVISFGHIKGFKTIKRMHYFRLLPIGTDSLSILSKEANLVPDSAFPILCDCEKRSTDNHFFLSANSELSFEGGNLQSNSQSVSGNYSIKLDSLNAYGLLSKYGGILPNDHIIIKVWRKGSDNKAGIVVCSLSGNAFYNFSNKVIETNSEGWELIQSDIIIPENRSYLNLGIYLWNQGKNAVWFDDLEIIKQPK